MILACFVAIAFCRPAARAAGGAGGDAQTRATLYKAEARKLFARDHWSIVRDGADGFTAVHAAASGGTTATQKTNDPDPPLMVHVSVTFKALSIDSTDCAVKIEGFRLAPKARGKKPTVLGPFKADYPENTKYIQKVLVEAEDRLGAAYPKYHAK